MQLLGIRHDRAQQPQAGLVGNDAPERRVVAWASKPPAAWQESSRQLEGFPGLVGRIMGESWQNDGIRWTARLWRHQTWRQGHPRTFAKKRFGSQNH